MANSYMRLLVTIKTPIVTYMLIVYSEIQKSTKQKHINLAEIES